MYYIVGTRQQYENLQELSSQNLPGKVLDSLYKKVEILDKHYGSTRDLQKDLGGYCAVFPTRVDWEESCQAVVDKHFIQEELYEYREEIREGGCTWVEELYMVSSDYGIVVFYPKDSRMEGGVKEA